MTAESRPTPVLEQPLRAASTTSLVPTNINFSGIIPTLKRFLTLQPTQEIQESEKLLRLCKHAIPHKNELETASRPNMLSKKKALD